MTVFFYFGRLNKLSFIKFKISNVDVNSLVWLANFIRLAILKRFAWFRLIVQTDHTMSSTYGMHHLNAFFNIPAEICDIILFVFFSSPVPFYSLQCKKLFEHFGNSDETILFVQNFSAEYFSRVFYTW